MKHDDIFQEVNELSPMRTHDHAIVLKDETNTISVRPYKYPSFHKNIIEELVIEMVSKGVIRTSTTFSALVVLV